MAEILSIKIIVVGDGTVGKSSLSQRFSKGSFTSEYKKTLGVDFLTKRKEINNKEVEFLIWDTAGQEYYDSITKRYYKGANAAIIVFSVENKESFESISRWKEKISSECGRIPIVLVMNKIDLDKPVISVEEANKAAKYLNLVMFQSSVKENLNIQQIFDYLAIEAIKNINESQEREKLEDKLDYVRVNEENIQKAELNKKGKNKIFKLADKSEFSEKKKKKCCK